jgi:hypothetical protein
VKGSFEHGTEPSGCIKCREIFEYLHNWRLLQKGSVQCSYPGHLEPEDGDSSTCRMLATVPISTQSKTLKSEVSLSS